MKKRLLSLLPLLWTGAVYAATPALFGTVTHVAADDTLSVRAQPDYRSRKLGAFPNGAHVYIDRCRRVRRSRWCHIHPDTLMDYGGVAGWVNAKFLRESNHGYVQIAGRTNGCYVSLKCKDAQCLVVTRLLGDPTVTGLHTEWIARSQLTAANNFSAQREGEEGYCVTLNYVDDYRKKKQKTHHDPAYEVATKMTHALSNKTLTTLLSLIHPLQGIRLSEMVRFGSKDDKIFTRKLFETYWKNHQQLDWGHTYGRGDLIRKDLWHYVDSLSINSGSINKIEKLDKRLRGFPAQGLGTLRGYSFRHTNPRSGTRDYDWRGIVIILAPHQGHWYVVGMLRDRWTI